MEPDFTAYHSCSVSRGLIIVQGVLYISESQLAFQSTSLFGDFRLLLPLQSVTAVESVFVNWPSPLNPGIRIRRGDSEDDIELSGFGLIGFGLLGSSSRDAVLYTITQTWREARQRAGDESPAKGAAWMEQWRCCCPPPQVEVDPDEMGGPTLLDDLPLKHVMLSQALPCSAKQALRLLFGDDSSFEVTGKQQAGGSSVSVSPWRKGADGVPAREVRWQQSLRALPQELLEKLRVPSRPVACCAYVRKGEPTPGTFVVFSVVRAEVPFGDTFCMHSKWIFSPAPARGATVGGAASPPKACHLEITYEVRFIKTNLLAPIIESANLREARKTFEQLRGLILSTCRPSRLSGMLNGA